MSDLANTAISVTLPPVCCGAPPCTTLAVVGPGAPFATEVCQAAEIQGTGVFPDRIIEVGVVGNPVPALHVVLKHNRNASLADDAYLALPIERFGSSYRPFTYKGKSNGVDFAQIEVLPKDGGGMGAFTHDDCNGAVVPVPGLLGNEVYQFEALDSDHDCTGPLVATAGGEPFGLLSGTTLAAVPDVVNATADNFWEMIAPLEPGTNDVEYLVTEFPKGLGGASGDVFRVLAVDPGVTVVTFESASTGVAIPENDSGRACVLTAGPVTTTLTQGQWCDVKLDQGARLTTNGKQIRVTQYMRSHLATNIADPSMMTLVSNARFACGHRFFSFFGYGTLPGAGGRSYINVVLPTSSIPYAVLDTFPLATICLGGFAQTDYAGTSSGVAYSWLRCRLPDPPMPPSTSFGHEHYFEARDAAGNPVPSAVYVYGVGEEGAACCFGAYSYPATVGFP